MRAAVIEKETEEVVIDKRIRVQQGRPLRRLFEEGLRRCLAEATVH
jgi:hypothetical protein